MISHKHPKSDKDKKQVVNVKGQSKIGTGIAGEQSSG